MYNLFMNGMHCDWFCRKQDMLEILKDFGKSNITPAVIARVLGMMAQTHSNLPESIPYLVNTTTCCFIFFKNLLGC